MKQQNPKTITGQVSWNSKSDAVESSSYVANEGRVKGPLSGKDVTETVRAARSSSRRSRKSETAFRTISEVAEALDVQQHVLRFWETKFSQVRPLKRGGGRRYYRPEDLALLERIHHLLYTEGYTIKGVQKLLKEQGKKAVIEASPVTPEQAKPTIVEDDSGDDAGEKAQSVRAGLTQNQRSLLENTLGDLKSLRAMISS